MSENYRQTLDSAKIMFLILFMIKQKTEKTKQNPLFPIPEQLCSSTVALDCAST